MTTLSNPTSTLELSVAHETCSEWIFRQRFPHQNLLLAKRLCLPRPQTTTPAQQHVCGLRPEPQSFTWAAWRWWVSIPYQLIYDFWIVIGLNKAFWETLELYIYIYIVIYMICEYSYYMPLPPFFESSTSSSTDLFWDGMPTNLNL